MFNIKFGDFTVIHGGIQPSPNGNYRAEPEVISPSADIGQTLPHTPETTTDSSSRSVAKIGQKRDTVPSGAKPNPAPLPVKKLLSVVPSRGAPGERMLDPAAVLIAKRPPRATGEDRAAEEAAIAAHVAQCGVVKFPPTGPTAPGDELAQSQRIQDARAALVCGARLLPGQSVTYAVVNGHKPQRKPGTVSAKPSTDAKRINIDIVTEAGVVLTKSILRNYVRASAKPSPIGEKA